MRNSSVLNRIDWFSLAERMDNDEACVFVSQPDWIERAKQQSEAKEELIFMKQSRLCNISH